MRAVQPGGPEAAAGRPRGLSLAGWAGRGPGLPRPGDPEYQPQAAAWLCHHAPAAWLQEGRFQSK